jgi:hypothetical protein
MKISTGCGRLLAAQLLLFLILGCHEKKEVKLNSYIPYETLTESSDFELSIDGQQVFVAKETYFGDSIFNSSQFFVKGETTIEIISAEAIKNFEIRPRNLEIKGEIDGKKLTFSVSQPQMLMITINDYEPLCLFQTPPEENIPDRNNENVIYFAKGVHNAGVIKPKNGQTIYLEQGAYVKGRIYAENVNNIDIKGRGILDARGFTDKPKKIGGIEFKNCNDILIDGIGLRTGEWWQTLFLLCNDVEVKNMNLMSFGLNNDGIDIDGVTNFKASNCFIGCGDDGFGWHAVDGESNGEPPTRNCIAENCVIYNTHAGNGIRLGASMETVLFEDITFRNITVLAHANAGIRSDHSDWATIKNLTFENFYIEQPGRPIEIRIEKTKYSNSKGFRDERGHIDGLHFKNVFAPSGTIVLEGYDHDHIIQNVSFDNVKIDDQLISEEKAIKVNAFVKSITFKE